MLGKPVLQWRKSTPGVVAARIVLILLILTNLWFIWMNSAKVSGESNKASQKIATNVAEHVVEDYANLEKAVQKKHVSSINVSIRSVAHFAEFIPLGLLFFLLAEALFCLNGRKRFQRVAFCLVFSLVLTVVSATGDEIHQLFVKGRTFQLIDILTDTLGGFCGCVVAFLVTLCFRKKAFK